MPDALSTSPDLTGPFYAASQLAIGLFLILLLVLGVLMPLIVYLIHRNTNKAVRELREIKGLLQDKTENDFQM